MVLQGKRKVENSPPCKCEGRGIVAHDKDKQGKRKVENRPPCKCEGRGIVADKKDKQAGERATPQQISRQKRKRRAGQRKQTAGSRAYLVLGRKENWATPSIRISVKRKQNRKTRRGASSPSGGSGEDARTGGLAEPCGAERWRVGFGLGKQGTHKEGRGEKRNCVLQIYEERDRRKEREKRIKGEIKREISSLSSAVSR